MPNYVTASEFDEYMANEFGSVEASIRLTALNDAERRVEKYCQRTFVVASGSSTRLYVPDGSDVLHIHDCTAVSAITLDGATISASAYQLEPTTVSASGLAQPYERVRYLLGAWVGAIPGKAAASVTASWGWTATPADVPDVVKQLGRLNLLRRRMRIMDAEYDDVLTALDELRRVEAFGL